MASEPERMGAARAILGTDGYERDGSSGQGMNPTGGEGPQRVAVLGQGQVGLTVATRAAQVGFDVVGFDVDRVRVTSLLSGRSHVDGITDAELEGLLGSGRYRPSFDEHDIAGFDVAVIAVPTPVLDGLPVLAHVEAAASATARFLRRGAAVVLESTTYPGTTEEVVAPILQAGSGLVVGRDFHLGFSPERIDVGNATWNFTSTPKVVSGVDVASLGAVQGFYDHLVDTTVPVRGTREAELAKLLENTFRQVNIALVNELSVLACDAGVDIGEVIDAAQTKPFGFMSFRPGPGVGGQCLTDVALQLSWWSQQRSGTPSRLVQAAVDLNDRMPRYVVERLTLGLRRRGKSVEGSRLLILGVAYKKNSSSVRRSPAMAVIEHLVALDADVRWHDDHAHVEEVSAGHSRAALTTEELAAADAVVLLTDHDDVDYDLVATAAPYVFDARHRIRASDNVEHL
jgi:UDP-N-acetyl-D-glucosamine dehydrogenase